MSLSLLRVGPSRLCSSRKLYAVNREVRFQPYATSFELAETEVTGRHWSLRAS